MTMNADKHFILGVFNDEDVLMDALFGVGYLVDLALGVVVD